MVRVACMAGLASLAIGFGASCFDPSYPQGLSCGQDGECPPGQECDEVQGICVLEGEGGGGDPDAGGGTSDPDAARGGTDGAVADADVDAAQDECTAQEIDDCDATCAEQGKTGQCTADGCECVDGGVRFAEAQPVPCSFPATKVEAVSFGDFPGYVGINEEGFFACFDAFDPESREGAPIAGATDFWVGNLFGDDRPSAAVSTAAQPVFAVRMESGTLSVEEHSASNEAPSYVVGAELDNDGFTDLLLSGSILTSLRQGLGGIFTEQKMNGNVPITEGTIFPDLFGAPLASGDLDGDGADEIVGLDGAGNVAIYGRESTEPVLLKTLAFEVGLEQVGGLSIGDLDRDGLPDILAATAEGTFWFQQQSAP